MVRMELKWTKLDGLVGRMKMDEVEALLSWLLLLLRTELREVAER